MSGAIKMALVINDLKALLNYSEIMIGLLLKFAKK